MKTRWIGSLTSALLLFGALAAAGAALRTNDGAASKGIDRGSLSGADPAVAVADLENWANAQFQSAFKAGRKRGTPPIQEQLVSRARDAASRIDPVTLTTDKLIPLARLYQMARLPKESVATAHRLLATKPDPTTTRTAQFLLLGGYTDLRDGEGLRKTLAEFKPEDGLMAMSLASQIANTYADIVFRSEGRMAASDLLKSAETSVIKAGTEIIKRAEWEIEKDSDKEKMRRFVQDEVDRRVAQILEKRAQLLQSVRDRSVRK